MSSAKEAETYRQNNGIAMGRILRNADEGGKKNEYPIPKSMIIGHVLNVPTESKGGVER